MPTNAQIDLRSSVTTIQATSAGPIIRISFEGAYPPGSLGNPTAELMGDVTTEAVQRYQPVGVLLDMTGFDYVWGDAILGAILGPLRELYRESEGLFPCCVVCSGRTAEALGTLTKLSKLFDDDDRGLDWIRSQLNDEVRGGLTSPSGGAQTR